MKGVGVDIVDVKRIEKLIKSKKFLEKIFTAKEIKYCLSKKNFSQHFAVRFAAKESVWKACEKKSISHKDIEIRNSADGRPTVYIKNIAADNFLISLSHVKEYAVAFCVLK